MAALMKWAALPVLLAFPAIANPSAPAAPVRCGIEMRNVALHLADGVVLAVATINGEFVSRSAGEPPVFDNPASYTLRMKTADVSLDAASLTTLLKQTLASHPSPLSGVTLSFEGTQMKAKGTLHKGVSVPFSMTASVAVTPDGMLRLHAEKVKAAHVPVKGMLDLLGLDVADLMKMPPGSGIKADKDDLLLDTAVMLPPPRTEAKLASAAISGGRLRMQMVGPGQPPARQFSTLPLPSARNYLYFFGGSIRFGKLTMTDADMQLIDANPSTPFDFFPAKYEAQLVAGYSRNTRRKGLQVFMPDYAQVASKGSILSPPKDR